MSWKVLFYNAGNPDLEKFANFMRTWLDEDEEAVLRVFDGMKMRKATSSFHVLGPTGLTDIIISKGEHDPQA